MLAGMNNLNGSNKTTNLILAVIAAILLLGLAFAYHAWQDSANSYRAAGMWTPH